MNLKSLVLYAVAAGIVCCGSLLMPSNAQGTPIAPVSYDMPNGDGQRSGGTYNYWDRNYSGSGNQTTDGAVLTGGLGKLTDGLVSVATWRHVSNSAGTGEYVAWNYSHTRNPRLTFHFVGTPLIDTISIQMDNSGTGGVFAPQAILIDGINHSYTAPARGTVGSVTFTGLGLTGNAHTIEFDQVRASWTFISEISFNNTASAVPETSTSVTLLVGLAITGTVTQFRRNCSFARRQRNPRCNSIEA